MLNCIITDPAFFKFVKAFEHNINLCTSIMKERGENFYTRKVKNT